MDLIDFLRFPTCGAYEISMTIDFLDSLYEFKKDNPIGKDGMSLCIGNMKDLTKLEGRYTRIKALIKRDPQYEDIIKMLVSAGVSPDRKLKHVDNALSMRIVKLLYYVRKYRTIILPNIGLDGNADLRLDNVMASLANYYPDKFLIKLAVYRSDLPPSMSFNVKKISSAM